MLGFPCDQFGHQEPGDDAEIAAFCESNFGVTFPLFAKVEVNGDGAHPLYRWLRREGRAARQPGEVELHEVPRRPRRPGRRALLAHHEAGEDRRRHPGGAGVNRFTARTEAKAVVAAERQAIWDALVDPGLLARMTPFVKSITADGDRWLWQMAASTSSASGSPRRSPSRWSSPSPTASTSATTRRPASSEQRRRRRVVRTLADARAAPSWCTSLADHAELPLPRSAPRRGHDREKVDRPRWATPSRSDCSTTSAPRLTASGPW